MNIIVEQSVKKNTQKILNKFVPNTVVSYETELINYNGFDSLGIVKMIVEIEDDLNIELDDYLVDIRNAKTVGSLIKIIDEAYSEASK